jgi:hypothetical protein
VSDNTWYIVVAVIILAAIPFAPHMVRFRIIVLRALRFRRFADWHERIFKALVAFVRVMLAVIAGALITLAITGS